MASSTRYYGLGFFDFGDPLGTDFAGQVEIDRFVFIDKQLYGLMSVFGNGVLNGWIVSVEETFSVSVSPGTGNINFVAARTEFPTTVVDLTPNSVNYIYAKKVDRTLFEESVDFVVWPTSDLTDPNFLLIAEVTVGAASITSINNDVRQSIGFINLIKAAIRLHKHRGGSQNPSKIDLASEVKGQLPSFRIADFDAEKITTGTFDLARMPLIDHQSLQNVGLLTHPQLDTFVKTLESSNKEIFGEISTANLLQLILAMKFIYDDPDSAMYLNDRWIDQYFINEFAVIPGITPNSFIDFVSSTADIDLDQHVITGIAPTTGTSFYVTYDSNLAWNSSYLLENLVVANDTVTLAFNEDDESSIVTIEGFESATASGNDLSGGDQSLFRKETVIISDNASIEAANSATNVIEGFYSGKFTHQQSFRVQYIKEFSSAQDWSTYDSFVLYVKCVDAVHGPVKMYFENSSGDQSIEYIVLNSNEITSNPDTSANDFEVRVVDLSTVPFRDEITKIVIFTDDLVNPFSFFIDYINIQRAILLPESGSMKIRYSSNVKVIFSSIDWDSIEPSGTEITVRARAADGTVLLNRAEYTPFINSGDLLNLEGTDIEIEVEFFPDSSRTVAPVLQRLRILVITEAELDEFRINKANEWNRGEAQNIEVVSNHLELDTPIYVDSYYFALSNTVNQVHENTTDFDTPYTESDNVALFGVDSPISPNTIFAAVESNIGDSASSRFFEPRSVRRKSGRTFVIADTYNDRILEYNEDGSLVAGFGSINYEHSNKIFPISASFDPRTGILYIVWSKTISFKTVDVSQITLQTATNQIKLIRNFDKILGLTTTELDQVNAEGQIMPIYLSTQNAGLASQLPGSNQSFIFVSNSTLSTGLQTDSAFYRKISTALGIPLYVGNFAYIDGIFSPTWVEKTDDDTYLVCNAKVAIKEWDFPSTAFTNGTETISLSANVSSIIEVNANNQIVFGVDNIMEFSPFVPGRAEKVDSNTLLVGGLRPGGSLGNPSGDFNFRSVGGNAATRQAQREVLNEMFFTRAGTPYVGAVLLYDTRSGSTSFEYTSAEGVVVTDVDIDPVDGAYVVAESSFIKSGRVIKLDASGNITFSFGEGLYSIINDINVQLDGSIVVST